MKVQGGKYYNIYMVYLFLSSRSNLRSCGSKMLLSKWRMILFIRTAPVKISNFYGGCKDVGFKCTGPELKH